MSTLGDGNNSTAPELAELAPGSVVAERFRIESRLAAGAFGEVWLAEHVHLRLRVALKVLRPGLESNPEVAARFAREAFLLGQIRSNHVARVIDFVGDTPFGPVLAMEFIEGPSLATVLRSKRLTIEEAIELGMGLATALRDLHAANIVHRDVKPANIIMQPLHEGGQRAVFVDLGVSRRIPDGNQRDDERLTEITSLDRAVGTLEYMAPEQLVCSRTVTTEADIYALGAILFRAVTGRYIFGDLRGTELIQVKLNFDPPALETGRSDRIAQGFEAVIARALARKLEERYELIDELYADLCLLRDAVRRSSLRRDHVPPGAPSSSKSEPAPTRVSSRPEEAPRESRPMAKAQPPPAKKETPDAPAAARTGSRTRWFAGALLVAAGAAMGIAATLAQARRSASSDPPPSAPIDVPQTLANGHCHVVTGAPDAASASAGTKTSVLIACTE